MYEMILCDVISDSYSMIMAIINFVCFGAFCICIAFLYLVAVVARLDRFRNKIATTTLIIIVVLLVVHFWLSAEIGIPLLVPPVDTMYFVEFMHVIQYIASVAIALLGAFVFGCAALKLLDDREFGRHFMHGLMWIIVLVIVHGYVYENFGVLIIFPPNLW